MTQKIVLGQLIEKLQKLAEDGHQYTPVHVQDGSSGIKVITGIAVADDYENVEILTEYPED